MADLENCPVTFFAMIAFKSATDSVSKNGFIKYIYKYKLFHSKNKTNTGETLQNGHLRNRRKKPLWRGQCVACPPKRWPLYRSGRCGKVVYWEGYPRRVI